MKEYWFVILLVFLLSGCKSHPGEIVQSPNILLFHADDMTWRDCEPYSNTDLITPSISRLAAEGVCFDNMFTSTAMCSPTRQQLYTGLFPVRSGAFPNHSMVYWGVNSLCHHFGVKGYRVALIGKVHHNPVESFPFEFLGGIHHDDGAGTDIYLDRIKPLLNQDDNPFFLVVSTNQPHSPWNRGNPDQYNEDSLSVPEYMVDCKETRLALKNYYAEISYADSLLGRCVELLEESGKADNTIVIFTSEQGSSFPMAKWTCYDLGLKTSFIIKWPGKTIPGTRNSAMTQYVDVVPTLLEAAGFDPIDFDPGIPDAHGETGFDGKSFLDVVLGKSSSHRKYTYGIHTTRGIFSGTDSYPVRSIRSDRFKLILNLNSSSRFYNYVNTSGSGIYHKWLTESSTIPELNQFVRKYMERPAEEFYDISADPFEMHNLADDPKYSGTIREMKGELFKWMEQQGDSGIGTEMDALNRQLRFNDETWRGYMEIGDLLKIDKK